MGGGGPYFTGIMINRQLANPQFMMLAHGSADACTKHWTRRISEGINVSLPADMTTLVDLAAIVSDPTGDLLRDALMTDPAIHALWVMAQQEVLPTPIDAFEDVT